MYQVPQNSKLKEHYLQEIESFRDRIKDYVLERDDISLVQNPLIEADYMNKIGCYEIELAEAEINERRAKRKLAMCKAAVEREADVDENVIDAVLDDEFDKWMNDAGAQDVSSVSSNSTKAKEFGNLEYDPEKLKKLYRRLCKKLHPDLCPNLTDAEKRDFEAIQKAYDSCDFISVVAYCDAYGIDTDDRYELLTDSQIAATIETLKAHEGTQLEVLGEIKNSFPYNMKDKLKDRNWVKQTSESLIRRAENCERHTARFKAQIADIIERNRK